MYSLILSTHQTLVAEDGDRQPVCGLVTVNGELSVTATDLHNINLNTVPPTDVV